MDPSQHPCSSCCSVAQSYLTLCDPWTAAHQASLSFTITQSLLKLMSIDSVMSCKHLILCHPLLLPPSIFPSIRRLYLKKRTNQIFCNSLIAQLVKNPPAMQETLVQILGQEYLLEKEYATHSSLLLVFSCGSAGKESVCNAGDLGLILGLGTPAGEGKDYPLQ